MSFQINPLNNDLVTIKNETAIARSVRNLIFTLVGERPYSEIGCGVKALLFENVNEITSSTLDREIRNAINLYEPRVSLIDVLIDPDYDNNNYNITISYNIVGANFLPQQLKVVLDTVR